MNRSLSHRLTSLLSIRRTDERGAVAVMTAIILALTLTGVGALAVDTGVLYTERQQAQNGADAAAMSVAQTCAKPTAVCGPTSGDPSTWTNANAKTSMAGLSVTSVCGTPPGLATCSGGDTGELPDCPTLPNPAPANYVEVHTRADNAVHGFVIGRDDHPAACSRVAWGIPGSTRSSVPFTIGLCQWNQETKNGTDFTSTADVAIQLNVMDAGCGVTIPGGFGWLDTTGCTTDITVGGNVGSNPGNGKGHNCQDDISKLVGNVIYVPVYDRTAGSGQGATFHIYGLAAFYLDGVAAPSFSYTLKPASKNHTGQPKCPGNACIWGYFVKAIVPVGSIDTTGTAPDLGLTVLQMAG